MKKPTKHLAQRMCNKQGRKKVGIYISGCRYRMRDCVHLGHVNHSFCLFRTCLLLAFFSATKGGSGGPMMELNTLEEMQRIYLATDDKLTKAQKFKDLCSSKAHAGSQPILYSF